MYRCLWKQILVCLIFPLLLGACSSSAPRFNESSNPLPRYLEEYGELYHYKTVYYCRLFNPRVERTFQGFANTRQEALDIAREVCLLRSMNNRYCDSKAIVTCDKRQQLEPVATGNVSRGKK